MITKKNGTRDGQAKEMKTRMLTTSTLELKRVGCEGASPSRHATGIADEMETYEGDGVRSTQAKVWATEKPRASTGNNLAMQHEDSEVDASWRPSERTPVDQTP